MLFLKTPEIVRIRFPSLDIRALFTPYLWESVWMFLPEERSVNLTLPSSEAVTKVFPSSSTRMKLIFARWIL